MPGTQDTVAPLRSTSTAPAVSRLRALGTSVTVATVREEHLAPAEAMLRAELDAVDRACSRFRADAEIWAVMRGDGRPVAVSPLLFAVFETACAVAMQTSGAVDPTVGAAVAGLGYDRDFDTMALDGEDDFEPVPARGWWTIELDRRQHTVKVPAGVLVDLGSSAKAFAAERAASLIATALDAGVLVSLGGDIAVGGTPPAEGWTIAIAEDAAADPACARRNFTIYEGGVASSSTVVRTWRRGQRRLHHIVDPLTGDVASDRWSLVTVAAPSCVDANAATTAAVVWGDEAVGRLRGLGYPARLVGRDGEVITICGWPAEDDDRSSVRASLRASEITR
jgi:thiamine biosynthesis lipoprotein